MSEEGLQTIKSEQLSRIITAMCDMFGISLEEATDIYYCSQTAAMIEDGTADLHCRSDRYLAEEVWREYQSEKGK
ncbi:MAG: DUF3791 domain-containing protein [Paludibacteraceae bacterium]|nr:DUF3791 domain-containing protein [Paludibacteraceae bacterium]